MLRVFASGMVGGVVLVLWSTLFSVLGPARSLDADQASASGIAHALADGFSDFVRRLPAGPAEAHGATGGGRRDGAGARPSPDLAGVARGLGGGGASGVFAAVLMSLYGGGRRSFAERVLFAVLLGSFAGCAMMVPDGGWTDFSLSRAAPLLGEVLLGWLLAGMVIAVLLTPRPRKVKAP